MNDQVDENGDITQDDNQADKQIVLNQIRVLTVVKTLDRLKQGFYKNYMKIHKQISEKEPQKKIKLAKILILLGLSLIILNIFDKLTLLILTILSVCCIRLIQIKVQRMKLQGGLIQHLPDYIQTILLSKSFIEVQFILQENIHQFIRIILLPFIQKDLNKAYYNLETVQPHIKNLFLTKGLLNILPFWLQNILIIKKNNAIKKIRNASQSNEDNAETQSEFDKDQEVKKKQNFRKIDSFPNFSNLQQLQQSLTKNLNFNLRSFYDNQNAKDNKQNRIIWDNFQLYQQKLTEGVVTHQKPNFKKKILESILFKNHNLNQSQKPNNLITKFSKFSIFIWILLTLLINNPKKQLFNGLKQIIYIISSLLSSGSLVYLLLQFIKNRNKKINN